MRRADLTPLIKNKAIQAPIKLYIAPLYKIAVVLHGPGASVVQFNFPHFCFMLQFDLHLHT